MGEKDIPSNAPEAAGKIVVVSEKVAELHSGGIVRLRPDFLFGEIPSEQVVLRLMAEKLGIK